MTEIRALESADVPAVAALVAARLPGWTYGRELLFESLLEHPWADPELPSLVAVDESGEVLGFMGAYVRRLRFDDRTLRGVCCSHLVVADDPRVGLAGTLLLRRMLLGPQDISWTDSATDTVVRDVGGFRRVPRLPALGGLDAGAAAASLAAEHDRDQGPRRAPRTRRGAGRGAAVPGGGSAPAPRRVPRPRGRGRREGCRAAEIAAVLPEVSRELQLRVDHDDAYLEDLFGQVRRALGSLVTPHRLPGRAPDRLVCVRPAPGWRQPRASRFGGRADADDVLGELVEHAQAGASAVLTGRAEPHLRSALEHRLAALGFARQPVLHVRDVEIRALLATDRALLSHLDGEWFAN